MATIKDVAKLAGVSVSSVSLVINGKRNISAEKYNAVIQAMRELKYRPSIIARNLKNQKYRLIGVILPGLEGHYAQILTGIQRTLDAEQYFTVIKTTQDDAKSETEIFEDFLSVGVSGIISVPSEPGKLEKYTNWAETGTPIVFLERKVEGFETHNVIYDNRELIFTQTKRLLQEYEPSELALVTGPLRYSSESDCAKGFMQAIEEYPAFDGERCIIETSFEKKRASFKFLNLYDEESALKKCYIFSDERLAECFLEIQYFLYGDAVIYALSGDEWSLARREYTKINRIPRYAQKLGEIAAEETVAIIRNETVDDIVNRTVKTMRLPASPKRPEAVPRRDTTIHVMTLQSNAMYVMERMAKNFTKRTGIGIDFQMVPFDQMTRRLVENPAEAPQADVFWVDMPLVDTLYRRGHILDLRDMIGDKMEELISVYPKGVRRCGLEKPGPIAGIPILMDENLLFYRKDLFQDDAIRWNFYNQYGFELKPPKTWAEFNYIAEFFTRAHNPNSPTEYGTALSLTCPTALMEEYYVRQWAFHGAMVDNMGRIRIDTLENARALESLLKSFCYASPNSLESFFEETFYKLLTGEVALLQGFPTHYLPFRHTEIKKNFESSIAIESIPGRKPLLGSWSFCISSKSEAPQEAFAFIKWVVEEEHAVVRGMLGNLIPVKATYESTLLTDNYPGLKAMNVDNFSKCMRNKLYDYDGNAIDHYSFEEVVANSLIKVFNAGADIMEVLKEAQRNVELTLLKR